MLGLMLLLYLGRILQDSLKKMTKSDQIKILNDKIKANNAQYNINRLNAEISAFSEGDLDKHEFLTRKDIKYKPNALDKFSPLGKAFNQGLDKKAENYKEESVRKLLKDIRRKWLDPLVVLIIEIIMEIMEMMMMIIIMEIIEIMMILEMIEMIMEIMMIMEMIEMIIEMMDIMEVMIFLQKKNY